MEQLDLRTRIRNQQLIAYRSVLLEWLQTRGTSDEWLVDANWIKKFKAQSRLQNVPDDLSIWEHLEMEIWAIEIYLEEENKKIILEDLLVMTGKEILRRGLRLPEVNKN